MTNTITAHLDAEIAKARKQAVDALATAKAKTLKDIRRAAPPNSAELTSIDDASRAFGEGA